MRRTIVAAVVLATTAACSGAASPAVRATGVPSTTTTVTSPASTLAATTSTLAPAEAAPQPSPDQAAAALLDAWRRGDRTTALRVASMGAVASLFGHPVAPAEARGCQDPVGQTSDCAFGLPGSTLLTFHTIVVVSGGWVVDTATFEN